MDNNRISMPFKAEITDIDFDFSSLQKCVQDAWVIFGLYCNTKGYIADPECPINPRHLYQFYENTIKILLYFYNYGIEITDTNLQIGNQFGTTIDIFSHNHQKTYKMFLKITIPLKLMFESEQPVVAVRGEASEVHVNHKNFVEYQCYVYFNSIRGSCRKPKIFPGAIEDHGMLDLRPVNPKLYFTLDKCPEYLNERGLSGYAREKLLQPGSYQQYAESLKDSS